MKKGDLMMVGSNRGRMEKGDLVVVVEPIFPMFGIEDRVGLTQVLHPKLGICFIRNQRLEAV